jgi:GTP cyclohydrolase FolE2
MCNFNKTIKLLEYKTKCNIKHKLLMPYNSVLHVSVHLNHNFFNKSLKLKYMGNMVCPCTDVFSKLPMYYVFKRL